MGSMPHMACGIMPHIASQHINIGRGASGIAASVAKNSNVSRGYLESGALLIHLMWSQYQGSIIYSKSKSKGSFIRYADYVFIADCIYVRATTTGSQHDTTLISQSPRWLDHNSRHPLVTNRTFYLESDLFSLIDLLFGNFSACILLISSRRHKGISASGAV